MAGTSVRDAQSQPRPVLALTSNSYDFGTVAQGTKVVHEFEVKNTGTADLVIQRLSPSCGCTATQLASPIIKPGASEKVRVTFDTTGFMGDKTKTVAIASNDTNNPEVTVTIKGQVLSSYTVEPSRVDFGEIFPSSLSSARQKQVTFSIAEGSELKITKVTSLSKYLVTSPVTTQANRATVTIEILPTVPLGEFRDRVIFELDGGRRAAVNVPVNASVKGDIRLNPGTISFGVVEGQRPLERRVQFENKGQNPVSIESITTSNAAISASMVTVQPGRLGVLIVKVDPREVVGDLKGTVDVRTNHPNESVVSLNVFGVLPPK
ncbi:MAG: hypothetical protein RL518_1594 [Pseudomonadota bacterium]